ncbi:MAG: Na/Pi cotransporter family protein [Clostridiales bacterium]|nr:Na/Pi cotransporter family protein [Clostridiales bacterium]
MSIFNVFSLLGGLAMFLFGMDIMGKALEKQAGSQLQSILRRMTDNPVKGLLLGLVVTAVIQSSSATTVMVVGFVNSGIMELSQAIGVIMGANVGTTVTSWILSLADVQGDSFLVQLMKPTSFSPILAFIGIVLYMTGSEKKRNIGVILLGFAILMTGMSTMSSAVEPLGEVEAFTNLFVMFQNPVLGMLVGAALTAVIQSSSASVGILQALTTTGAVTFGSAIPIIMGQNIGTTVTAMISSVGANKNARRAALVHLYFNVIGSVGFLIIFYALNAIFHFSFIDSSIDKAGIALVHTVFNVTATVCMLPFTKGLEKLAYLTVPEDEEKDEFQLLDERFLNTPALALERGQTLAKDMSELARQGFLQSLSLVEHWDEEIAASVSEKEASIDLYEDKIGTYLVKLSSRSMNVEDSHTVSFLFHAISDWERIGDYAVNIKLAASALRKNELTFSPEALEELQVLENAVQEVLDRTIAAFAETDYKKAKEIPLLNLVVNDIVKECKEHHVERLQSGACSVQAGIRLGDLLTDLQRVSGHCANIAIDMIEVQQDSFQRHAYREEARTRENFMDRYNHYREQFGLTGDD